MPRRKIVGHTLTLSWLILTQLAGPLAAPAAAGTEDLPGGHRTITGVVTQKGNALVLTTPAGATPGSS